MKKEHTQDASGTGTLETASSSAPNFRKKPYPPFEGVVHAGSRRIQAVLGSARNELQFDKADASARRWWNNLERTTDSRALVQLIDDLLFRELTVQDVWNGWLELDCKSPGQLVSCALRVRAMKGGYFGIQSA